jgi:hypothetical protein
MTATIAKTYRLNPTIGTHLLSLAQRGLLNGAKSIRGTADQTTGLYRLTITATPEGHANVAATVRADVAEFGFATPDEVNL